MLLFSGIAMLTLITGVAVTVWVIEQKKRKGPTSLNKEVEKKLSVVEKTSLSPAVVVKLILRRGLSSNDMTAGLLHLVSKKAVKLNFIENEQSYVFTDQTKESKHEPLTNDERYLLQWLLYRIGDKGAFRVDDLERFTSDKDRMESYLQELHQWEKETVVTMEKLDLYRPLTLPRLVVIITGVVGIVISSVFVFMLPFFRPWYFLSCFIQPTNDLFYFSPYCCWSSGGAKMAELL
ncbi:DUF2207 family protein [Alteribacter populi]|uniref:DUF2207 family protein n=1 Tax=Alteribacter populi TaxID=2011011 RepID=UPI000BBA8679|nr:DUF2207 domain-containing protein [Alteribacter populi]